MERPIALTDLPTELLIKILQYDQVTGIDLLSVYQTCRHLQQVAATDSLWGLKLRKKWPNWENHRRPDSNWSKVGQNVIDTFKLCSENIAKIASELSPNQTIVPLADYHARYFSDMMDMYDGLGKYYVMMFLRDFSSRKINTDDSKSYTGLYNSANQHFVSIFLDYLNKHYLKIKWHEMGQDPVRLTPERAALLFMQWMRPEYDEYDSCLDAAISDIVSVVKSSLSTDHPFHKMNPEETEEWSNKLYYKNQYDPESCKEIMKIAMDVLNNQKLLNPAEPTSSTMFIKDVIEQKTSNCYYSLIILGAVLRRCGVHVEMPYCHTYYSFLWQQVWSEITPLYNVDLLNCEIKFNSSSYSIISCPGANCSIANGFLSVMASHVEQFDSGSVVKIQRARELIEFLKPQNLEYGFLRYKRGC